MNPPNRIEQLRKARGLTQEDLAARVSSDTAISTISRLERGDMALTLEWIHKLARALRISAHDIIAEESAPVRLVPVIGQIAAGNWSDAVEHPDGWIPATGDVGGPNCFALRPIGDSMNEVVDEGGYLVVDPDQFELVAGKIYAVRNAAGETTFKRYQPEPPALLPCSTNPAHRPILLGREPFTVIGRVTWVGRQL